MKRSSCQTEIVEELDNALEHLILNNRFATFTQDVAAIRGDNRCGERGKEETEIALNSVWTWRRRLFGDIALQPKLKLANMKGEKTDDQKR